MSRIIDDFVSDWNGYTEEYPDWLNTWIESKMVTVRNRHGGKTQVTRYWIA